VLADRTSRCFSSANRSSHYNRQRVRFERNISELEHKGEMKISSHVKVIAEMFTALSQTQDCKQPQGKRRQSFAH
jgi:hypothetical protein